MYHSRLYRHLGVGGQERLLATRAWLRSVVRERGPYQRFARQLEKTQWMDADALRVWQDARLDDLLGHVQRHVPWYAGQLAAAGTVGARQQLQALPYLEKADVRRAGDALHAGGQRFSVRGGTSGSTGSPLMLKHDLLSIIREQAFVDRQLSWAGYRKGEPRAWWRGDLIVPTSARQAPYWRYNRAENMLMLSSYHLAEDTIEPCRVALERFDPVLIQAYPSSIAFLASYLRSIGAFYRGTRLRAVVTSSETLSEDNKRLVEDRLGCRVFDWYGGYERVAAIGTCEQGRLHILDDYSLVELRDAGDGSLELVGTGFHERAMPLLRYRTGDHVSQSGSDRSCACGRAFPVVERVLGRDDDVVITPEGRRIGRLDHIFKGVEGVAEAQIRQVRPDAIIIAVVPLAGFDSAVSHRLQANARDRLGPTMDVGVELVGHLPRTANGKLRGVVREPGPRAAGEGVVDPVHA